MKKIISLFAVLLFSLSFVFGCDKPENLKFNLQEEYDKMVAEYVNSADSNVMFGNDDGTTKTVTVSYQNPQVAAAVAAGVSSDANALRFYALNLIEQSLLNYIFKYYETWNASFYENAYDKISKTEKENLHKAFNSMRKEVAGFYEKVKSFESEFDGIFEVNDPQFTTLTLFTYQYNMLIEKCFVFMKQFIELHTNYVFDEDQISVGAAQRMLDEYYYNIAKLVYFENVKPFNYGTDANGVCDLYYIMKTFTTNPTHNYLLIGLIENLTFDLGNLIFDTLTEPTFAEDAKEKMDKFNYYQNQFQQNFEVYFHIYNDLDFSNLIKYRFGVVQDTTLEEYLSRYTIQQKASHTFAHNMQRYILPQYVDVYMELIAN